MVKLSIEYEGDLRCHIRHNPSGASFKTDAPKDNQGKGESFSPTDLIAAGLASCIATTIGIYCKRHDWNLKGMRLQVEKVMIKDPERRIGRLIVDVWMPTGYSRPHQQLLEKIAHTCPVHKSLHPQVDAPIIFHWPEIASSTI